MTATFTAASGRTVVEVETPSGDWSFRWSERSGDLDVTFEAVWVPGRDRWLRFLDAGGGPGAACELDWPAVQTFEQGVRRGSGEGRDMSDERAHVSEQQTKRWLVYLDGRDAPIVVTAERFEREVVHRMGGEVDTGARFYNSDGLVAAFDAASEPSVVAAEARG